MKTKQCRICQRDILVNLEGDLCDKCIQKREYYYETYYDVHETSKRLGISEEQVRRRALKGTLPLYIRVGRKYLWPIEEVEDWIAKGQPIRRLPQTPLQEKAYVKCRRKDHSWLAEEHYEENGYSREVQVDEGDSTITVGYIHTCWFCGYKEYHHI